MSQLQASVDSSLVEVVRRRALASPDRRLYTFLNGEGEESASLTLGELDRRARAIAARLQAAPGREERVLLLYPPGLDFVAAFFGCLYAGAVAVPAYPPRSLRGQPRLRSIASDCAAAAVLTTSAIAARKEDLAERIPELSAALWLPTDVPLQAGADDWDEPDFCGMDPAFLQYTSGSTAEPKGVVITHGSLLHNEEVIRRAFGQSESSVVVGWLPLYHDMGLIGNVLQPLYSGGQAILMSPQAFLEKPRRWLEAIGRYGATTSGGPNFAYDLCMRKIGEAERAGLELGTWRVAFTGAEPVRRETMERFAAAFASCGFRREAFYPCYGLAEATLFVSGGSPEELFLWRSLQAPALEEHRVVAADGGAGRDLVGCGRPDADPAQTVIVVDPELGTPCPPDRIGEIWISGPGVAAGYWNRPRETELAFRARLVDREGTFLRTGDLGFIADGELFVTGRLKDLIILRGRNLYPQDIERTVESSHRALRPGCGAAFAVDSEGEERLVVVQEVDPLDPGELAAAAAAIRRAVAEEHEAAIEDLVLVRRGTVPKTSSGKIQRGACRAAYLAGSLTSLTSASPSGPEAGVEVLSDPLERFVREEVARLTRVPPEHIDPHRPLIRLGLDSLAAVELQGRLEVRAGISLPLSRILEGASLAELEAEIRTQPAGTGHPVPQTAGSSLSGEHPLSAGQKALWFTERLAPESGVYNLASAARLAGRLDPGVLERAFAALSRRHPALRTTFVSREDSPWQRVSEVLLPDFRVEGEPTGPLGETLRAEAYRPFDLQRGPLVRVRLWTLASGESVLLLVVHHLVADFWSLTLLVRELASLIRQESEGVPARLRPPTVTHLDHVRWQEALLASPRGEELWRSWSRRLSGELPVLDLPTDRPRPKTQTFAGISRALRLEKDLAGAAAALAASQGATLHMLLVAGFQALLQRYTGQQELLLGSPAAGRGPGLTEVVGYLVNPLVLRLRGEGDPGFLDLLVRVRSVALEALEHQDFPFPLLVERLPARRDPGRSPLFQAMLVLQRAHGAEGGALGHFALGEAGAHLELGGLSCRSIALEERRVPVDLMLMAAETDSGIELSLQLASALFDGTTAERMLGHFANLLRSAVASPGARVSGIELLTAAEIRQLVAWGRAPECPVPELSLEELIAAQAERTPEAVALVCGETRLSYGELDRRARRVAARLRALGVGPETRVAICLGRSVQMIVGLLGILRAGGAYVPLDPAYPAERLALILDDSGATVLLAEEGSIGSLPASGARVCLLDEDEGGDLPESAGAARPASPGNLAWLIYTSGSTGRPKGVAIEHRSAVAFALWARQVFSDEELSGVLAATSICFDLSVFELFVPLCWGGRVVLVENVLALPSAPAAGEVRLVNTVPSAMAELVRVDGLPGAVVTVSLAGEPLTRELVQSVYRGGAVRRVLNLYGPSEDTTYSTFAVARPEDRREPTIGRPVANTRVDLLDAGLQQVPAGIPGELCLAGSGLARGYHGRPGLTAERFVPDPFGQPGGRLYRTGDLARWSPSGEIQFLGRLDSQVKVRGFRVELGEVEVALRACPGVREAVALSCEDPSGARRLVAFVVPAGQGLDPAELRQRLRRSLPEFMIPAIVLLDSLPLTPNGKVDQKALARVAPGSGWGRDESGVPRDRVEEILAGVWEEVLGVEGVGVHDDFFALGGHSLLAVRAQQRIRERLRADVPLRAFFHSPTVSRLRHCLTPLRDAPLELPPRPQGRQRFPLSFAQERLWFLQRLAPESAAYHLAGVVRLEGPLSPGALRLAWDEVVRRQEILRIRIRELEGRPVQEVAQERVDLPLVQVSGREEAERLCQDEARRPLDLAAGPPVRTVLLSLEDRVHHLLLVLHHLVADEESLEILLGELLATYRALSSGREPALPDLPFQYADYAEWQRAALGGRELEPRLAWWEERLAGLSPLELPIDWPRPSVRSGRGAIASAPLDPGSSERLIALARQEGCSLFMALLAAFDVLLCRITGQHDIVVGCPVSGRDRREVADLVGLFVNTLVLRAETSRDGGFRELLRQVRAVTLSAHEQGDVPFELLVDRLRPERSLSQNPLFGVTFALQRPPARRRMGELAVSVAPVETGTSKFDLSLFAVATEDGIELSLEHACDLFETPTALRLLGHLSRLIAGAVAAPDLPLAELQLLSPPELQQLLVEWGSGPAFLATAPMAPVHELFEEQARIAPDRLAVTCGAEEVTYGELDRRAGLWAHWLMRSGVRPEVPVALWIDRSVAFVVAALAVLKAGGAYVPMDPEAPRARILDLLGQAGIRFLLSEARLAEGLEIEGEVSLLDSGGLGAPVCEAGPRVWVDARNLAYVIFTSGSTGAPKGVAVAHASLSHLVRWHQRAYGVSPEDRATQIAGLGFDAAVWEIWPYLTAGASLHIPHETIRSSPVALVDWMADRRVTLCFLPTPLAEVAMAHPRPAGASLRALLTGGDRLHRAPLPGRGWRLVNHYGPTESTVVATSVVVPASDDDKAPPPPIGRPIGNLRACVLDAGLRPVPAGVRGELFLGSEGLARGYLGRPDLTAERFVPDPLGGEAGSRLYRTGDLVRHRGDGSLEFLGRCDQQIKVQGFRIEPAEIEAALCRHPMVMESAVTAWEDGHGTAALAACFVPRPGTAPSPAELRQFLRERLPGYMVPARISALAALPLTPNGKIDRRALSREGPTPGVAFVAARNPTEERLAGIWSEVLEVGSVGVHDNFFELGGRSLLAIEILARIRSLFGVELSPRSLFEAPTVADLAALLDQARPEDEQPLVPLPRDTSGLDARSAGLVFPASFAQRRLWFLDRLEPGSPVYNLPTRVRLQGSLSPEALRRSLGGILERHEALRTTFAVLEGEPVQVVHRPREAVLSLIDLGGLPGPQREAEAERIGSGDALRPFDLERGPLLRCVLLRLAEGDHLFLLTVHHIIWDGWSLGVFIRELSAQYRGFAEGRPAELPALAIQYADYADWQRQRLREERLERHLSWWRERLAGAPAVLELPADHPRPTVPTFRGACERCVIDGRTVAALRELARREGATVFMTLLAVFTALLSRCTRQLDLVVGTPTANRGRVELEPLIGFFANSLVLRLDLAAGSTFRELLARVREVVLEASSHQEIPFEKLVEALKPARSLGHNPLYQVVFALDDSARPALALPGLAATPLAVDSGTAKFDLALYMEDREGRLSGLLEYNRGLFERATAARLVSRFEILAAAAVCSPDHFVSELPLLDEAERQWLLVEPNDTHRLPAWSPFVHRWFEGCAAARPGSPAVSHESRTLTYGELDRRANQLAHRLQALGVGPEVCVAVTLERSPELIVALLGIFKAGGVYVPLDPVYPPDRLAFMLRDCQAPVLLTHPHLRDRLPESQAVPLLLDAEWRELALESAAPPPPRLVPGHLAYVIYTSGSTGQPKGAMISHGSLASYTATACQVYGVGAADRVLQFCSISFDISLEEIVPCLARGGELVLRTDAMLESVATFLEACREREVTMLSLPTAYWHEIVLQLENGGELPASLRLVVIAGERALPERLAAWRRHAPDRPRLVNTFGLTESTIISTAGDLTAARIEGLREVPIGRAIADSQIYLLDRLMPVPAGVPGEVYVGGGLLARGYLRRPDLTAERFLPHPFAPSPGERVYKTGDLARVLPDGELEFLGRGDHQVKLRGYRIELGEIETALLRIPEVAAAVVQAVEEPSGQKRLVAYLVPARQPVPRSGELRSALRETLPDYMVPSAFVVLDALPMTPNGKLDRAALPQPEGERPEIEEGYVAPRDETEQAISNIWKEVLSLDRVGIYDNFFDLGGHSLLLIRVHERLKRELGCQLPIVDLFKHSTVNALARQLSQPHAEPENLSLKQKAQQRAGKNQTSARRERFLKAREERGGRAAPTAPAAEATPGPQAEIRLAHARLSRASESFLDLAWSRPELRERGSFALLDQQSPFTPFPLQSWPVFVDQHRVGEHARVSVGLCRLIKSLPQRVFANDPEGIQRFYGLDSVDLAKSMLDEPSGIEIALGRGDFLDTPAGLQCLEVNMVSHLGGWQAPLWAEAYLRVPVIQEFLRREGLRVACRDTIDLLFSHLVREARRGLALNGELNVAFIVPDDLGGALRRDFEAHLDAAFRRSLQREGELQGQVTLRRYAELVERQGCLYAERDRIHAVVEAHDGGTAAPAARCFKAGSLHLYNAAARTVLTDKRNLALLSELGGSHLFTSEENELIRSHVPWTRCLTAATREIAISRREEMVVKRARVGQGRGVHVGRFIPAESWRQLVAQAVEQGDWVLQERVESLPVLGQSGAQGCSPHEVVWGLFAFGDRYAGGFLSLRPQGESGVVNVHQGASEGVILEILP